MRLTTWLSFHLITQGICQGNSDISERDDKTTPVLIEENTHAIKVFHGGNWGYICATSWDSNDAKVVCRMQGFWHGTGTAQILKMSGGERIQLDNVVCTGLEADIAQCRFDGWELPDCNQNGLAVADCSNTAATPVRLVNGYGPWEGRLEVEQDNIWRPVCTDGWDDRDASVVCKALGLSDSGIAHLDQKYGTMAAAPLMRNAQCSGREVDLAQCKAELIVGSSNCSQAGVECYNCGGEFTGETGILQSENYPANYPGNLRCLYIIRPPDNGILYKMDFTDFGTEVCCDTIQVGALNNASAKFPDGGVRFSGGKVPPRQLGKAFGVVFISDGSGSGKGFRAEWKPARVEDVVTVNCTGGRFNILVDIGFLKRLYPASSEASIGLADPACMGRIVSDMLLLNYNTDACGTKVVTVGNNHVYNNFLVDRIFANQSSQIVREHRWKVPITCSVPRTENFHLHYDPYPELESRSVRDLPKEEQALVRKRELREKITQTNYFNVRPHVYSDAAFSSEELGIAARTLGQELFLRVTLEYAESDLLLVVNDCFTLPGNSGAVVQQAKYYLMKDSCAVDANTKIMKTSTHSTDIRLVAFEFAGDLPQVFITCEYTICPQGDITPQCQQTCSGKPNGKRSDRPQPIITRHVSSSVTVGPIVLERH